MTVGAATTSSSWACCRSVCADDDDAVSSCTNSEPGFNWSSCVIAGVVGSGSATALGTVDAAAAAAAAASVCACFVVSCVCVSSVGISSSRCEPSSINDSRPGLCVRREGYLYPSDTLSSPVACASEREKEGGAGRWETGERECAFMLMSFTI